MSCWGVFYQAKPLKNRELKTSWTMQMVIQHLSGVVSCVMFMQFRGVWGQSEQVFWRWLWLILNALNTGINASHIHIQQLCGWKYSRQWKMAAGGTLSCGFCVLCPYFQPVCEPAGWCLKVWFWSLIYIYLYFQVQKQKSNLQCRRKRIITLNLFWRTVSICL